MKQFHLFGRNSWGYVHVVVEHLLPFREERHKYSEVSSTSSGMRPNATRSRIFIEVGDNGARGKKDVKCCIKRVA